MVLLFFGKGMVSEFYIGVKIGVMLFGSFGVVFFGMCMMLNGFGCVVDELCVRYICLGDVMVWVVVYLMCNIVELCG